MQPCPVIPVATNGKRKKGEESSESEEETEVTTPNNKKAATTPQTFPKANKKVSLEVCCGSVTRFPSKWIKLEMLDQSNKRTQFYFSFSPLMYHSVESEKKK